MNTPYCSFKKWTKMIPSTPIKSKETLGKYNQIIKLTFKTNVN